MSGSNANELADAPAALVAALLEHGRIVRARRGQIVLASGARSDDIYIVRTGQLQVTLFPSNGREVIVRNVGPGQIFGELAAIDGQPRSATIIAIDPSDLACVPAAVFRELVTTTPDAALWFARKLTRQIRRMTDRIFELSALNVRGRLHCQLLRMCAEAGVADNQSLLAPVPTHETLAALIGTHREAVTRELSYLSGIGLLHRDRRSLKICDVERLAGIVRELTGETAAPVAEVQRNAG